MPVVLVDDMADPRLADYRHVPDPELLRRGEIFVAEGRLVVRTLLADSPFVTRSVLVTETAYEALRDVIEPRLAHLLVFVVSQGTIQDLTGFNIHRGSLAIGERRAAVSLEEWLRELDRVWDKAPALPHPLVVLEQIVNADNVGGIFRNTAAFGGGAVVLGPNCCDPLYRKAIRTSMGAALRVPFVHAGAWPGSLLRLKHAGFTVVALTPRTDAMSIEEFRGELESRASSVESDPSVESPLGRIHSSRIALVAGSEGPGLSAETLAAADVAVRIPMARGVDSLNVSTAVAIALYRVCGGDS